MLLLFEFFEAVKEDQQLRLYAQQV